MRNLTGLMEPWPVSRLSVMTSRVAAPAAKVGPARHLKVGPRTWLVAVLAGISTYDPSLALRVGPYVAVAVLLSGRPARMRITAPVVLSAAFLLWAYASQAWSLAPTQTSATVVLWAQLLLIFVATLDLIQTRAQIRLVAIGYLSGAFFAVANILITNPNAASESLMTGERIELGNANINYVAYALSAAFAVVVLLWITRDRTKLNFLLLAAVVAALVLGVNLSGTRGALLGLACVFVWLLLCKVFRRPPIGLPVFIVLAVQVCISTGIADQASLAYEFGGRATGDWSGRLIVWPEAREVWGDNPILGVGAGAFSQVNMLGIAAHNMVLQTGTGLGIIGVVLLVALMWCGLAGKGTGDPKRRLILVGAFLAASAPAYLSGVWETAPAAWVVLAIFCKVKAVELGAPKPPEVVLPEPPASQRRSYLVKNQTPAAVRSPKRTSHTLSR